MAGNAAPIFVGVPRNEGIKLSSNATNVDGSGSTALFTADSTNGSRIHAISATPTGNLSAAVVARFFIEQASTYWILGEKAIPSYTASAGVPAPTTSFLEFGDMPFLDASERWLTLAPGQTLYAALLTVPTNAIHFLCHGGDY